MRKVFVTLLATLLLSTLLSTTVAQTSQVSYHNGETVPLFQGTLAYQDNFSFSSLADYIISSDEAYYSAQYYGERADAPVATKLAVLDGYVVWQFDFVDQIICIDAQNATNAYALPVDGIAYTYIIDDFAYNNAVYSNTVEAVSYADAGQADTVVYDTATYNTAYDSNTYTAQEAYNISSGGYADLYAGYSTYEEYLAAYMASTQQAVVTPAPAVSTVSSYSEVVYLGTPATSTISIQPVVTSPAVVGPVENLGIISVANTVGSHSGHDDGYDAEGYDDEGYDREGYNRPGYDREGYDREGYSAAGYDREGYNRPGYNREGYDREGYNELGYNAHGYNRLGESQ